MRQEQKRLSDFSQEVQQRLLEQFSRRVLKGDQCWLLNGWVNEKGYAYVEVSSARRRYRMRAHRYSYERHVGPIPGGMMIDHTCHVRNCVNPEHLRVVNNKQNLENREGTFSSTGERNVYWTGPKHRRRLYVKVEHNQRQYRLFGFETIEEAAEAARQLRLQLFTHNTLDRC